MIDDCYMYILYYHNQNKVLLLLELLPLVILLLLLHVILTHLLLSFLLGALVNVMICEVCLLSATSGGRHSVVRSVAVASRCIGLESGPSFVRHCRHHQEGDPSCIQRACRVACRSLTAIHRLSTECGSSVLHKREIRVGCTKFPKREHSWSCDLLSLHCATIKLPPTGLPLLPPPPTDCVFVSLAVSALLLWCNTSICRQTCSVIHWLFFISTDYPFMFDSIDRA